MFKTLKRLLATIMIAVFLVGALPAVNGEAAVPKPKNLSVYFQSGSFDYYMLSWKTVPGADYYQLKVSWTDGSHSFFKKTKDGKINYYSLVKQNNTHIHVARVRARKGSQYSAWSDPVFITPCPKNVRVSLVNPKSSKNYVNVRWNTIYGCSGYNVFLSSNPSGKWYWNSTTQQKATATSATIKSFRGSKLKRYTNYYVRVVTRRKYKGRFWSVPFDFGNFYFYQGVFMIFPGVINWKRDIG